MKLNALLHKGYNFFQRNPDVQFYSSCLRNESQESLFQRPTYLVREIFRLNLICRVPFIEPNPRQRIGGRYLSKILLSQPVNLFAGRVLKHRAVAIDLVGTVLIPALKPETLFQIVEEVSQIKGFAQMRAKLDDLSVPLTEIYQEISRRLEKALDPDLEEKLFEQYCLTNRTGERLAEIVKLNGMKIRFLISSSYSRQTLERLLEGSGIPCSQVLITSERGCKIDELLSQEKMEGYTVVSSDYRILKNSHRQHAGFFYFEDPRNTMQRIRHPKMDPLFRQFYDVVCGLELFSGERRHSYPYELSYMCIAPLLIAFLQRVHKVSAGYDRVLFLLGEGHPLCGIYRRLFGRAGSACAWISTPKEEENNLGREAALYEAYLRKKMQPVKKTLIVDLISRGGTAQMAFEQAELEKMNLSGYLSEERIMVLDKLLEEQSFLIRGFDDEKAPLLFYPVTMERQQYEEIWGAIEDFGERYCRVSQAEIPLKDAVNLYTFGIHEIKNTFWKELGGAKK